MRVITIDFETYWDPEHTLTKMSPMAYVMSPKTEIICAAIKVGAGETQVFFGESEVRQAFAGIDWGTSMVVAHNMSGFDAMILAWRFGVRPKMWACTLAMARPLHSKTTGNSLAKLVAHYRLGVKNQAVLMQTKGKNLKDFTRAELADMRRYNQEDTDQCYALFNELKRHYSPAELWQIDATIRMLVEPAFEVNRAMLEQALVVERDRKRKSVLTLAQHLKRSGIGSDAVSTATTIEALEEAVRADLASSAKFATLLRSLDVEVPMKPSPTNPNKEVPALAKTDEAFLALQEHDNEVVAAAARGRLAVKSTLLETRIGAFLDASAAVGGKLPVPLNYCGADTTGRWSGWAYNCMPAGHEVLTPQGWVDISEWKVGTPIMQWWPDGSLNWCSNPGKVEHHHKGEMVRLTGPFAQGLFTPDHRVPKATKTKVSTRTAGWIATHSGLDGVPAAGVFVGTGTMGSKLTPDQVRLMVATAADGCLTQEGSLRWGFKRQRKVERIQQLLDACGIDAVRKYDYREKGGHWVAILAKGYVPAWLTKGFGAWVLSLSREALDALVEELKYWDGMEHSRSGNTCFFTTVEDQALWVSTALHLSGTPARVGARSQGRFDVYARSSAKTSTYGTFELFDGMVYCPQVDSSFFLVRHKGAIHVTGNCQNLPRINPKMPKVSDALRNCLEAPPGHKIIVSDLSGIELRVNHFLWNVKESIDLYKSDPEADLYRAFAAARYRVTPEEVTKDQRQLAKVAQLGLGFGAGWRTFQKVAKLMGGLELSEEDAEAVTVAWRVQYAEIVQGWKTCHAALGHIYDGVEQRIDPWGLCVTCAEGIRLPTGRIIRYPDLRSEHNEDGSKEWVYGQGRHKARIYAGKVDENCVQALARDVIAGNAVDFFKLTKLRPALMVHAELVYVVPESDAEAALAELQSIMRTPPNWWPELVTWSEGDVANTYGAAK
jgi:hypothetical protein